MEATARLLLAAHGTASPAGIASLHALSELVAAARPSVSVSLAFLDVSTPTVASSLDDSPTVVVPGLLSTGYHVETDLPALIGPFKATRVARHFGPDPLVLAAVADRLSAVGPIPGPGPVALVTAPSSRRGAAVEVGAAAIALGQRLGRSVVPLVAGRGLREALGEAGTGRTAAVATYLLAEGRFASMVRRAAEGLCPVAPVLGAHPLLAELIWRRYDECRGVPAVG
jgi:sirohydrochlorin ferrochelatase